MKYLGSKAMFPFEGAWKNSQLEGERRRDEVRRVLVGKREGGRQDDGKGASLLSGVSQ
jgi:hypothetical protein